MLLANKATDLLPCSSFSYEDVQSCLEIASEKQPARHIAPLSQQGGCSFTIAAHSSPAHDDDEKSIVIIQFRMIKFALSPTIARESRTIYGSLAPAPLWFEDVVTSHGALLQVCAMTSMSGTRFSNVQPKQRRLCGKDIGRMCALIDGMAKLFATGWEKGTMRRTMDGKVGKSLMPRLRKLEKDLPVEWMRCRAGWAADAVQGGVLDCLPVVLNHGDLLPSNVMVDGESWELSGLIDWAEAEYLPFGVSLYGIEHLLGFQAQAGGLGTRPHFTYYDQADFLRNRFRTTLLACIPQLADGRVQRAVLLSRQIGVLLWHGFAWDDGKIERVVNELDDWQEVAYLGAFLRPATDLERPKL